MAHVELTPHLKTLFPALSEGTLTIEADTVLALIDELEVRYPGIKFYLCDERGRLRRHVNVFIDGELIIDRPRLSDRLAATSSVFIAQALTGG